MIRPVLLVLDFDGVICDSIDECFASSWIAYHRLYRRASPPGSDPCAAPEAARADFARLRPFIRTGEDFVLIQEMLEAREPVRDQAGFDAAARRAGAATRARFRELFYQARTELLESDRDAWLGLNRIYPHVKKGLASLPPGAPVCILSTKKPRFIAEILAAHAVQVPAERIFHSDAEPKLAVVERLRQEGGHREAILVEDQIDALRGNENRLIRTYLATWGYVKEEWLQEPLAAPLLTPEGFLEMLDTEFGPR